MTTVQRTDALPTSTLTPREWQIARLIAIGLSSPAIADALCLENGTVREHLRNAYRKLGIAGCPGRLPRVLLARWVWEHEQGAA